MATVGSNERKILDATYTIFYKAGLVEMTCNYNLKILVLLSFLCGLTILAYFPGMQAGFYFDDKSNIVEATVIHWDAITIQNLELTLRHATNNNRIISNISFALNYLAGGLEPAGYHWVNLIIHLLTGAALIWTCCLLCKPSTGPNGYLTPLVASILAVGIFLLHPLNIQAVTFAVQRMTSLAALFVLLSLALYITARKKTAGDLRWFFYSLSAVSWGIALGSKENAVVLPVVLCVYEYCFYRQWWQERVSRLHKLHFVVIGFVLLAGFMAVSWFVVRPLVISNTIGWLEPFSNREFSGYERLLTQARVHFFYLSLLFWPNPSRLNLDHDFLLSSSLFTPWTTGPAVLAILILLWFTFKTARNAPYLGFPLSAYIIFHLIESGPVSLELVFEHRMYLPMAALSWLVANVLVIAGNRVKSSVVAIVVSLFIILFLSVATYKRNTVWGDKVTFLQDCADKSPSKFRPHYNLGTELGKIGRYREGLHSLQNALAIKPTDSWTHNQVANIYMITGRYDAALAHYRQAVEFDQENVEALYNLAILLDKQGSFSEALPYYFMFVKKAPVTYRVQLDRVKKRIRSQ